MVQALVHSQKRANCSTSAAGLLPCCHQADIRMCSHRLHRLDDNKFTARCQQACCKLIVNTFYPKAWCKLFQQLAASLQISSCNKSDFYRLAATWWSEQTCCNLLTACRKPVKFKTCRKPVDNLQQTCYHQAGASDANALWFGFMTARQQLCSRLAVTCAFLAV